MILTPNYSLKKPEPGDNLKASQGFFAESFDTIDTRLKADADGIAANVASLAGKAPLLSPLFRPSSVDAVGVRVQGAAGQTGNFFEARNDAGQVLARVGASGSVFGTILGVSPTNAYVGGRLSVDVGTPGTVGALIRGAAGQTANLAEFQDSAGAVVARMLPSGSWNVGNSWLFAGIDQASNATAAFAMPQASDRKGLVVRGAAGQTANLAEFQNSAGTVLAAIQATGRYQFPSGQTAAVASAGASGGLPAQVAGYLIINIDNVTHKVPYYHP